MLWTRENTLSAKGVANYLKLSVYNKRYKNCHSRQQCLTKISLLDRPLRCLIAIISLYHQMQIFQTVPGRGMFYLLKGIHLKVKMPLRFSSVMPGHKL